MQLAGDVGSPALLIEISSISGNVLQDSGHDFPRRKVFLSAIIQIASRFELNRACPHSEWSISEYQQLH